MNELPSEIHFYILDFFNEIDYINLLSVSSYWHNLIHHKIVNQLKSKTPDSQFRECCEQNHVISIRKFLNIKLLDYSYYYGFNVACQFNYFTLAKFILNNFRLPDGSFITDGQCDLIRYGKLDLLKDSIGNAGYYNLTSYLPLAASNGHQDIVLYFLSFIKCMGQVAIIHDAFEEACKNGNKNIADILVKRLVEYKLCENQNQYLHYNSIDQLIKISQKYQYTDITNYLYGYMSYH